MEEIYNRSFYVDFSKFNGYDKMCEVEMVVKFQTINPGICL